MSNGGVEEFEFEWVRRYNSRNHAPAKGYLLDGGNIGYLKVNSFQGFDKGIIDQAFREMQGMRGLIIDLRDNGGGDIANYGIQILNHLVSERQVAYTKDFRNSDMLRISTQKRNFELKHKGGYSNPIPHYVIPTKEDNYAGIPVMLLVNEACFSATDIFISIFSDLRLGLIVGRNDLANSGQVGVIEYHLSQSPHPAIVQFSTMVSRSASGVIIEDRLVQPDIIVPLTLEEILGERDVIFERGLEEMRGMVGD